MYLWVQFIWEKGRQMTCNLYLCEFCREVGFESMVFDGPHLLETMEVGLGGIELDERLVGHVGWKRRRVG